MVAAAHRLRVRFAAAQAPASLTQTLSATIAFAAAYALTAFWHAQPMALGGMLTAWWISRVLLGVDRWLLFFSLLTAVGGPLFEAGWSALGFFTYVESHALGVPVWLPALYLHVGLLARPAESLVYFKGSAPR